MDISEISAKALREFDPDNIPTSLRSITYPTGWISESQRNRWRECVSELQIILARAGCAGELSAIVGVVVGCINAGG
jgi:hypothetical protein